MGQRITRVNELVKREVSKIIHTQYQQETVCITITEADVAPDLRHARIFFSVIGDALKRKEAIRFLSRFKKEIRYKLGKAIVLKYLPYLEFQLDPSIEKGVKLIDFMDEIHEEDGHGVYSDENQEEDQEGDGYQEEEES